MGGERGGFVALQMAENCHSVNNRQGVWNEAFFVLGVFGSVGFECARMEPGIQLQFCQAA